MQELADITTVCTANDLKMVIRLIKGDLRIQVILKAKYGRSLLHFNNHSGNDRLKIIFPYYVNRLPQ
jgi:hypothetical protein